MIEGFALLHDEDDIEPDLPERRTRQIIRRSTEVVPIHASWCLLPTEEDTDTSVSETVREHIRDHPMSKKRLSARENLFEFVFCESVFFSDHSFVLSFRNFYERITLEISL